MAPDPLAWLDEACLAAVGAALGGADLGDAGLRGSVAVVVPATGGRPRRSRAGGAAAGAGAGAGPASVQGSFDVEAGRVVAWRPGEPPSPPAAVLTVPADDARSVLEGRVEPSVLFMQGRLKVDGDMRAVLAVLRATASAEYGRARERLVQSLAH